MDLILQVLVVAFLVALAWHFLTPPCNFRIVVRKGRTDVTGPALGGKRTLVSEFFEKDLPDLAQARVEGYWDGRRLRLRFRGPLSPRQQQRIRNFLSATL